MYERKHVDFDPSTVAKRPKILALANLIGRRKKGASDEYTYADPEYVILSPEIVTDEMADLIMTMKMREKVTCEEVAARAGRTDIENVRKALDGASDIGILIYNEIVNNKDGKGVYWYETWVPGVMEMMNNHPVYVHKYPEIAWGFEGYGRLRGATSAGNFPPGIGLMRVIPIESAIDGNSRRASYEEITHYLNDNTIFSVSNCSCRTSREELGEGCGHLKEDMCIQMGHAAEYYIRTKRAREITREEAFAIIKRAEENGLMHQIPNIDGEGDTHAICNCCGCGCYALRSTEMFINADMSRSNYTAQVDKEKCVACGECVKNCPVNALQLGQKLESTKPVVDKLVRRETPRNTVWTEKNWNKEYRTNRKMTVSSGTSPCKTQCPAHIGVQGYIKLAGEGRYLDALELIKRDNPFPAICGRICPRTCENECTRAKLDDPLAIDEIKRFVAEQDLNKEERFIPRIRHPEYQDKKIAVIGSGPSGLSCAYYLAVEGYKVMVFEKEAKLGGMLTLGIPNFRLEKEVIEAEIDVLRELGVEFTTNCEIGRDKTIQGLRDEGYKAFYVAIGASKGRLIGLEGETSANVQTGVDFLKSIALDKNPKLGKNAVVIGGGNVAVDVARSAIRSGSDNVKIVCLESADAMPALDEEVEEALADGIEIIGNYGPKELKVEGDKVVSVIFKKCTQVLDENKRFAPIYDENDTIELPVDDLLLSIGQQFDYKDLLKDQNVELNPNNTIKADETTLQTSCEDIFTGGDIYTGPNFAIVAIASGKEAAISIHRFVNRGQSLYFGRNPRTYLAFDKDALVLEGYDSLKRNKPVHAPHDKTFKDNRRGFTEEQMKEETKRCLGCGATVVDEFLCVGCGQCTTQCKFDAISLKRTYDEGGLIFEKMKAAVVKTVIKKKFVVAAKNISDKFTGK